MTHPVKIALYIILVALACVSGVFALARWKALMDRPAPAMTDLERIEPMREPKSAPPDDAASPAAQPDSADTKPLPATNELAAASNQPPGISEVQAATNATAAPAEKKPPETMTALGGRGAPAAEGGSISLWTGVFLFSVIGLGFLIAMDVSHYFGNRTVKFLYNDEGEGVAKPEYEQAEQVWANGDHLEAIRMMRDYLQRNPREQFVALRIAEIYEKDLGNYLASALEYEEVLKHKLKPDRWGWAAIHLCNLYFKLDQAEKAFALLRRLVNEYPGTPAADKARKRLEQVDAPAAPVDAPPPEPARPMRAEPAETSEPESNLPPGFRPKK